MLIVDIMGTTWGGGGGWVVLKQTGSMGGLGCSETNWIHGGGGVGLF